MTSFQTLSIADRLERIRQRVPDSVRLIAVTKKVAVEAIREAYDAGVRDFGESRVQEAIAKQEQLQDLTDITWHLIGHLQRNKALKALQHFHWIHSLDTLKLAQRLNQLAGEQGKRPNICLQVKLWPDPNKKGWEPSVLLEELAQLDQCHHLNMVGLMAIPPLGLSPEETLRYFESARSLAEHLRETSWQNIRVTELSMGMSGDYPMAIQAGATMIRLGQIVFGART